MASSPDSGKGESANWPNKRLRAHIACEACRKRKIRCDSNKPTCFNCVRSEISCVYPLDGRRKRGRVPASTTQPDSPSYKEISRRLNRVEALLEALVAQGRGSGVKKEPVAERDDREDTSENYEDEDDSASDSEDDPDSIGTSVQATAGDMDLLHLGDRRAPVVVKLGDDEPLALYTHGFTTSLLNPARMRKLCEKIGNMELGKATEERLTMLWRRKMEIATLDHLGISQHPQALDHRFMEECMELQAQDTSNITGLLIDQRDMQLIRRLCCPDGNLSQIDYTCPYSLLYNTVVMRFTGPQSPLAGRYSEQYLNEKNLEAFRTSIRAFVPCCHATFLLLRLLLFTIQVMYRMTFFPRLRSLVAITLSIAYDLGLHRGDGSRLLTAEERQRRSLVWIVLQDLDVKVSASLSCVPLAMSADLPADLPSFNIPKDQDLQALLTAAKLNQIYMDVFHDLFSQHAQRFSVRVMMKRLCKLVARLDTWFSELPESSKSLLRRIEASEDAVNAMFSVSGETPADTPAESSRTVPDDTPNGSASTRTPSGPSVTAPNSIPATPGSSGHQSVADAQGEVPDNPCADARDNPKSFTWQFSKQLIEANTLTCYYHILTLVHSVPAFSPSCLKVYTKIPDAVSDSLNVLDHSSKQILRVSFSKHGLPSLGQLPLIATNAFSAIFLKQIRDPWHPTNGEELLLIYQYIFRFKKMTNGKALPGIDLVLGLWLTFAHVLTQLNKQWLREGDKPGPNQREASQSKPQTRPQTSQAQVPQSQHPPQALQMLDPQVQAQQAQHAQVQQAQTQHAQAHAQSQAQAQVQAQAHAHQVQHIQNQHAPTPTQQTHPGQQPVYMQNVPFYQPYAQSNFMQSPMQAPPHTSSPYAVPVDRPVGQDPGYMYSQEPMGGMSSHSDENSLWDMFNDYGGIEVDTSDQNVPYDTGNGETFHNCIIA